MRSKNPVFAKRDEFAGDSHAGPGAPGGQRPGAQQGWPGQQPGYQQPGYQQPGYQQAGYQQQGDQQQGYQQQGYQQQGYQQAGYQQPQPPVGSPQQLGQWYQAPSATPAQTGRMTYDDVVMRTATLFGVLLLAAAVTWFTVAPTALVLPVWIGSMLVGLGLGLFISLSKKIRPGAIVAYAAVEGVFLGSISYVFENVYDGIVFQAILATLGAFAAMLVAYKTKVIRATPKFTRFLIIATIGYAVFSVLNFLAVMLLGLPSVYSMGILGIGISLLGVGLASLNLILDFDHIERGIRGGLPQQYAWVSAFGLLVTLVWLYIEMLRLLSILRGND